MPATQDRKDRMKASHSDRPRSASVGPKRRPRVLTLLMALCSAAALAVGVFAVVDGAARISAAPSPKPSGLRVKINKSTYTVPSCPDVSHLGALHVDGKLLLKADNTGFAYYGITVYGGLELGGSVHDWTRGLDSAMAQIKASTWWHANTVRIQLSEQNVFNYANPNDGLDTTFLKDVCQEVQQARRQGQEVVISDQTEWPDWSESGPTARSIDFWKVIGTIFRNQQGLSFDLYNEPRLNYPEPTSDYHGQLPPINTTWVWNAWKNGATVGNQKFLGMQALYNAVRANGDNNVLWIEGPFYDDSLGMASQYQIQGSGFVWSIHHPTLTNATNWTKFFGYLAKQYPMVDGEWGQYASTKPECRAGAQNIVPLYLKYLRSHNIGMIGWSLQPGAMLADPHHYTTTNTWVARDTTDPTHLRIPSRMFANYSCSNKDIGEGAGLQLMNYFKGYSHLPSS